MWSKIRRDDIRFWESAISGPWDAAVKGSSALRAGVLGAFHDELHTQTGDEVASLLWDMDKFYDSINVIKLISKGIELGYPVVALALGMVMHMAMRVLKVEDSFMECEIPANGIIAG